MYKRQGFFPVSIPGHGIALNMTVQSYNGLLEVGLTACRRAMPDVADLGNYVVEEHARLRGLIEALPVHGGEAPVIEAAVPVAAKKRAPVKKAGTPRRRATATPVAGVPPAKRSRKAAANGARVG